MRVNKEVAYIFLDAILLIIILLISGRRWSRPTLRSLLHSDKTMFSINRLFNQSVRCSGKKTHNTIASIEAQANRYSSFFQHIKSEWARCTVAWHEFRRHWMLGLGTVSLCRHETTISTHNPVFSDFNDSFV